VGWILVFKRTGHMCSGHVPLVARVVSAREILVDHANWHRGTVSRGMSVIDTSRDQDWTQVAIIDLPLGKHGRSSPTFGFIYPGAGRHKIVETRDTRSPDSYPDSYIADREGLQNRRRRPVLFTLRLPTTIGTAAYRRAHRCGDVTAKPRPRTGSTRIRPQPQVAGWHSPRLIDSRGENGPMLVHWIKQMIQGGDRVWPE